MAPTTTAEASTDTQHDTPRVSETEAARRLGVIPATLRTWRLKGLLADGLVTETPSPAPNGKPRIRYDADWIANGVSTGKAEFSIFATPNEPYAGTDA